MQIEQLFKDNSFNPKMTTFKQVTSDPLQEHGEICYCKTVACIVAVEWSLIGSLKHNIQLAASQPSHKWLEVRDQNELQKDSAAHLCQILPSSLTILSTQLFCIP